MLVEFVEHLEDWAEILHLMGENPFKIKAYEKAVKSIEDKLRDEPENKNPSSLKGWPSVGPGIESLYQSFLKGESAQELQRQRDALPEGLLEISKVSGLGPKKARAIVEELGVKSLMDLLYAARAGKLAALKGFSEKTAENIVKSVEFLLSKANHLSLGELLHYYERLEAWGHANHIRFFRIKDSCQLAETVRLVSVGVAIDSKAPFKRIEEVISALDLAIERPGCEVQFELYSGATKSKSTPLLHGFPKYTQSELKIWGTFHAHTTESDGKNTLLEMKSALKSIGLRYLGISDHSQSSFYANGLKEDRLEAQRKLVEKINADDPDFSILWGIESDILADGSLDYDQKTLSRFDFVIASIHSRFGHEGDKMTQRILKALENRSTNFLGHWSGREVLGRRPYDFDHEAVLQACKENQVVLELNCNTYRLDPLLEDLKRAKELGVYVSINADAHSVDGFRDLRLGRALLDSIDYPQKWIVNAWSRDEVVDFLQKK